MKGILNYLKAAWMLIIVSLPALASAHPGHGDHTHNGWSVIHYFTQPQHALVSVAIVISLVLAFVFRPKSKATKA